MSSLHNGHKAWCFLGKKGSPLDIHTALQRATEARNLRQSTVYAYEGFFKRLGIVDDSLSKEEIESRLLAIDSINSRRSAAMAVRAVLGVKAHVPAARPKRYPDLPGEDSLRLALMLSKHEVRGLLMAYGGLRIGEACAVTGGQLEDDRLTVDRQVLELHATPERPRVVRLAPTKSKEGIVILPHFLCPLVADLKETATSPGAVRESLKRAGNKVGINLTPHSLRHWYATTSLARGVSIAMVSRQLRHSNVAITMNTYAQARDTEIHDAWG
jgi:integrase